MKLKPYFFACFLIIFPLIGFSQDGTLDNSFNDVGFVITDFFERNDRAFSANQQSDGKIIVVGQVEVPSGDLLNAIARYTENGTLDLTFGNDGLTLFYAGDAFNSYSHVSISNDDSIIAAGDFGGWGEKDFLVSKFLPNGDLDLNFGNDGHAFIDFSGNDDRLYQMKLLEDSKILTLGMSIIGPNYVMVMARHLPNGELDTTFGNNGQIILDYNNGYFESLSFDLQDDHSIIIAVGNQDGNDPTKLKVFRLSANGILDTSFGTDGFIEIESSHTILDVLVKIDRFNRVVLGISELSVDSTGGNVFGQSSARRFDVNGQIDNSFGGNGMYEFSALPVFHSINIQENNRILFAGNVAGFEGTAYFYKRLFNEGSLDESLVDPTVYPEFETYNTILQDDGKILVVGETYWFDGDNNFIMTRYNNDPLAVPEFNAEGFKVFPNPSSGNITISHKSALESEISYQILDATARIINIGILSGEETHLDLSVMQNGLYFLKTPSATIRLMKN
jgi:uncharacterized delta-60 repeat protein